MSKYLSSIHNEQSCAVRAISISLIFGIDKMYMLNNGFLNTNLVDLAKLDVFKMYGINLYQLVNVRATTPLHLALFWIILVISWPWYSPPP